MADAKVAVFGFVALDAGGDELEFFRPADRQVVVGEIGGVAEMRIPAFAGIDEEYAVAGVFDDAAAIAEVQSELGAFFGRGGKHDEEVVGAAAEAILEIHAFVLEERESARREGQ